MLDERLEILFQETGKQQADLANYLKVAKATVSQWKTGKRQPDLVTLKKIAEFFDCTTDYLLGLTDHKKPIIVDLAAHRKDGDYDKPLSEETHKILEEFVQFVDRKFGKKASGVEQDEKINKDSRETRD